MKISYLVHGDPATQAESLNDVPVGSERANERITSNGQKQKTSAIHHSTNRLLQSTPI
jgi:hypothetical protein